MRFLTLIVLLLAALCGQVAAEPTVLLIDPPKPLLQATQGALLPWGIRVARVQALAVPSESMPGARDRARTLCTAHAAQGLVWTTTNSEGSALWVYDYQSDRVVVRKLTVSMPLSDADAAALALSIKTLLMHTTTAPAKERFGAEEAAATPAVETRHQAWFATSGALVRHGLGARTDARLALALHRKISAIAIGIGIEIGPGYEVKKQAFRGHLGDIASTLEASAARHWRGLEWAVRGQFSLHRTALDGTLVSRREAVAKTHYNPALAIGTTALAPLGAAKLGISVQGRYYTRQQRFLVQEAVVAKLPSVEISAGLALTIPL